MRSLSSLLAAIFFLALALPAAAQEASETLRTVTDSVSLAPDGQVVLTTSSGRVIVSPWDRTQVSVQARIQGPNRRVARNTEISVEGADDRVEISDELDTNFLANLVGSPRPAPVSYFVRVPATADVEVNSYSSSIQVQNVRGDLELNTYTGLIDTSFERLIGDVTVNNYQGDTIIRLPEDAGFRLEADLSMGGSFETNFSNPSLNPSGGSFSEVAVVSGGGPTIAFTTSSDGRLFLLKR